MNKEKRGEILTSNVVILMLLVIGFAILVFVVFILYDEFPTNIDKESCHQSIVYRSAAKIGGIDAVSEKIPLKCKTEKICFSISGDGCEDLSDTKDNRVRVVELPDCEEVRVGSAGAYRCDEAEKKIVEELGDNLISCHSMLGEGKLNFLPNGLIDTDTYGLICSRIAFDKEAKDKLSSGIDYSLVYNYLRGKNVDGKSALEYVYSVSRTDEIFNTFSAISSDRDGAWAIDPGRDRGYIILAGVTTKSQIEALSSAAGVAFITGSALVLSGIGSPVGAALIAGSAGSLVFFSNADTDFKYINPSIQPFSVNELKEFGIYSFEVTP